MASPSRSLERGSSNETIRELLTRNRTEEIGEDVWEQFVVPPFFDLLDLHTARKPRHVEGGRGCGKTMLLRYFSHQSAFSSKRRSIPTDAASHIGLYWRADTQFARVLQGRGYEPSVWDNAFGHWIALSIGIDLLNSLESVAASACDAVSQHELAKLDFSEINAFDEGLPNGCSELRQQLDRRLHQFETWVANAELESHPRFLPGTRFVSALVQECRRQLAGLNASIFYVYVDEYENLLISQQKIINTYLKHSSPPLIFHIATKRNGMGTTDTSGEEQLVEIADFRTHDVEAYLAEEFDVFAAEVLLLLLAIAGVAGPVDPELLRDPGRLAERRDPEYRSAVLRYVRAMLPGLTQKDLADVALADTSIRKRLVERIARHLRSRGGGAQAEQFVRKSVSRASITCMALLARKRYSPSEVLTELDRHEVGETSNFDGGPDWIHNNFVGCLLSLYEPEPRTCPIYSGFDTYCLLAHGNMRHLLELCHRAISRSPLSAQPQSSITPDVQADAARETSATFLGQIKSFGTLGIRLHSFALRLGSLFALAHQRPTQSEPEVSHFSIVSGGQKLGEEHERLLREAIKWSVLFEEEATKIKELEQAPLVEYVLNPIYAPYFGITYRKKRKLDLGAAEFHALSSGTYDDFTNLMRGYIRAWAIDEGELNPTLFSHLEAQATRM